jgi:thiol-disulfide isomerase/thioredoxin
MGKASRTKFESTRQARIAAQRAAAKRAEQRRRLLIAIGSVVVVVAVVVTFVLVKVNSKPGTAAAVSEGPTGTALTSLVNEVTSVPSSTLDSVGGGSVDGSDVGAGSSGNSSYLTPVTGSTLTSGGKPEVLYIGAEYCPFCAAERWAMIVALSRFGTFKGLSTIHSSSTDTAPNTPSFTFYGSTYTSKYVSFVSVETTKNYRIGNSTSQNVGYVQLQTTTAAENELLAKYDPGQPGEGGGPIPFIDVGNHYAQVGDLAGDDPTVIDGLSWSQIGADLSNPSSPVAKAIDGSANYLTAAICKLTGNQPASACTPAVKALEAKL